MVTTKTMTTVEFYKLFPWVMELPLRPQCKECLLLGSMHIHEGKDFFQHIMTECHTADCSRMEHNEEQHILVQWGRSHATT